MQKLLSCAVVAFKTRSFVHGYVGRKRARLAVVSGKTQKPFDQDFVFTTKNIREVVFSDVFLCGTVTSRNRRFVVLDCPLAVVPLGVRLAVFPLGVGFAVVPPVVRGASQSFLFALERRRFRGYP